MVLKRDFNPPNKRERAVSHLKETEIDSAALIVTVEATTIAPTELWCGIVKPSDIKVGRIFVIRGFGIITTHDNADRVTVTLKLNEDTLIELQSPAGVVTDDPWHFKIWLTIREIGIIGVTSSHGDMTIVDIIHTNIESLAINTTVESCFILSCVWSDTLNSLKLTQCYIESD